MIKPKWTYQMKISHLVTVAAIVGSCVVNVNAQHMPCGSAQVNNEAIANDPAKAELQRKLHEEALEFEASGEANRGGVKVIPVVVHVIHNDGPENIYKEQVLDAIEIINEDFRMMNSDISQIVSPFDQITADAQIEFRLAQKDPNGNCTQGITRTKSTQTYDGGEGVKDLISWNTSKYLNIWVVDYIDGAGGYSFYPGNAPGQSHEGILVRDEQFGSIGQSSSSNFAARTLTHEIGHYLNLPHPWGNSNENAVASNCSIDDGVSDTPNTIGTNQTCPLGQTTCNSLDNVQNFMDYSTCAKMFTQGQASRMNSALNSFDGGGLGYYRRNLWQQSNLVATGTNDGFVNVCAPIADFSIDKTEICAGTSVSFSDASWNADVDATWNWNWSFSGGTPATSSDQNPTITYNTPGTFNVTLTVSNSTGSDSHTINSLVTVQEVGQGSPAPDVEGMEDSDFPEHSSDPNLDWIIEAESSTTWQRSTATSHSGDACARINLRSITEGLVNSLISHPIDMSAVATSNSPTVTFWYAHAPRISDSQERLRVYVSKDCGETWQLRFNRAGGSLHTTTATHTGTFVPNANEWEEGSLTLPNYQGEPHVLVKFEATSDREHALYIDDVNIVAELTSVSDVLPADLVSFYPNPTNNRFFIESQLENTLYSVYDLTGKLMIQKQLPGLGRHSVDVNGFSEGIYTLVLSDGTSQRAEKLVIIK